MNKSLEYMIKHIPDLKKAYEEKKITLHPLNYKTKKPPIKINGRTHSNFWQTQALDWDTLSQSSYKNFATFIGFNPDPQRGHLACIDIDGYKDALPNYDQKKHAYVCDYIFKILKKIDFPYLAEKTWSGGYHIIFFSTEIVSTSDCNFLKYFCFPKDFKIPELRGLPLTAKTESVKMEAIEVYSEPSNRYIVISPSYVEENGRSGHYEFLNKIKIEDLTPVKDLSSALTKALSSSDLTFNQKGYEEDQKFNYPDEYIQTKSPYSSIDEIPNFKALKENILNCYHEGSRHFFAWPLICNFRRKNYSALLTQQIFQSFNTQEDMVGLTASINNKYAQNISKLAGWPSLEQAIKDYCIPDKYQETLDFFKSFFLRRDNINLPEGFEKQNSDWLLDGNILYIPYKDNIYWKIGVENGTTTYCIAEKQNDIFHELVPTYATKKPVFQETDKRDRLLYNNVKARLQITKEHFKETISKIDAIMIKDKILDILIYNDENDQKIKEYQLSSGYDSKNLRTLILFQEDVTHNLYYCIDEIEKKVYILKTIFTKDGEIKEYRQKTILNFIPKFITILQDKLNFQHNSFKILTVSSTSTELYLCDSLPDFLQEMKKKRDAISEVNDARRAIATIIRYYIDEVPSNVDYEEYASIEGIHYIDEKLVKVEDGNLLPTKKPSKQKIQKALRVLKKFYKYNSIQDKTIFSALIRWFTIAPYHHYLKTKGAVGNKVPYILIHGATELGKTPLIEALSCINNQFEDLEAGSAFANPAKISRLLGSTTMPLRIDELGPIFKPKVNHEDIDNVTMLKDNYNGERIKVNAERDSQNLIEFHGYRTAIFNSNHQIPEHIGPLQKRMDMFILTQEDKPTQEEADRFNDTFKIGSEKYKNSDFEALKYIGMYTLTHFNENIVQLARDYNMALSNAFSSMIEYADFDMKEYEFLFDVNRGTDKESIYVIIRDLVKDILNYDINTFQSVNHRKTYDSRIDENSEEGDAEFRYKLIRKSKLEAFAEACELKNINYVEYDEGPTKGKIFIIKKNIVNRLNNNKAGDKLETDINTISAAFSKDFKKYRIKNTSCHGLKFTWDEIADLIGYPKWEEE